MVTFIEDQELQQLHRVREAAVEGSIGIDAVRHCVPHPFGALLGHLRDAMSIAFGAPLVSRIWPACSGAFSNTDTIRSWCMCANI